jgi:exodeoxyribonuclease-5
MISALLVKDTAKVFEAPLLVPKIPNPLLLPVPDPAEPWTDPFAILSDLQDPSFRNITETVPDKAAGSAIEIDHLQLFGSPASKQIQMPAARPSINWNSEQDQAFKTVFKWLKSSSRKPVFRLFGYAGTGKSTMAREISWNVENGEQGLQAGEVLYAAYTGKAAAVLRSKGCVGASTIHSLIYRPVVDPVTGTLIGTKINEESPLRFAKLLIVDEVSMVNAEVAKDLMSFGVPILVLGDPGQLDPIQGEGYFTQARPDVMLQKIERQAAENPIIYLATLAREGKTIKVGWYGDSRVSRKDLTDERIMEAGIILTGMRNTRSSMNRRVRMINGNFDKDTQFPVKGDTLMCMHNNKVTGVLNGTLWTCSQPEIRNIMQLKDIKRPLAGSEETNIEGLHFYVRSHDIFDQAGDPVIVNTVCSTHHFDESLPEPHWREIAGTDQWGFGYASTLHKGQGSQWDDVIVIDESHVFPDQVKKWRYTAFSRAAIRVHFRI